MVTMHFHLPEKSSRLSKPSSSSDWKINLILVLLVVQTLLLVWFWWTGHRPSTPAQIDQAASQQTAEREAVEPSEIKAGELVSQADQPEVSRSYLEQPIRVQVLNGCGVRGLARRTANCLRSMGFDVRETGNADRYDYPQTQVVGRVNDAILPDIVADSLGGGRISMDPDPDLVDVEVTVILGEDYSKFRCP
jgi:hypothetical protein